MEFGKSPTTTGGKEIFENFKMGSDHEKGTLNQFKKMRGRAS